MKLLSLLIRNIGKEITGESSDTAVQPSDVSGPFILRRDLSKFSTSFGYRAVNKTKVVNGKLFVLGSHGTLMVSDDGENFTKIVGLNEAGWNGSAINDIDYNASTGLYVVVGNAGMAAKSTDLLGWQMLPAINGISLLGTSDWLSVFSFPQRWLIFPRGKQYAVSFDGNNAFVTIGTNLTGVPAHGISSYGGGVITTYRAMTNTQVMVITNYTVGIITAATGGTATSSLNSTVRPVSIGVSENLTTNFACFGSTSLYSTAGNFQYTPIARTAEDKYMNFSGGKLFICRSNGSFRRSSNFSSIDLTVDLSSTEFGTREVNSVQYFNGKWRVFGPGIVIATTNFSNWESLIDFSLADTSFSMNTVNKITPAGNELLIVGSDSSFARTIDGINFSINRSCKETSQGKFSNFIGVEKHNNLVFIHNDQGNLLRSTNNGETWSVISSIGGGAGKHLFMKLNTKYIAFQSNNNDARQAQSTNLDGDGWSWSSAPYNAMWGVAGSTSNNRRVIRQAAYGGNWLTLMTNYGYILNSNNDGASYSLFSQSPWGEPTSGAFVGSNPWYHVYGFANGRFLAWNPTTGVITKDTLASTQWGTRSITSITYHDGYYYFGSNNVLSPLVARTPDLNSPTWEFFPLPSSWQSASVNQLASFAGNLIAAGALGKFATGEF